ncbi:MAG TPA: cytochrome c oxidase assembly protein [Ktedonobacteraceae bacterium]|nr:cytochrome c oxidase assembly protein [Ktedonobacteraceae bacterium]
MADLGLTFWLTAWNWEPSIVIGTALLVGLYLYGIGPLRRKYHLADEVKRGQVVAFLLGVFIMFLAIVSPLDELGDSYLFSAHMVQHLFITIVGPPLLLMGTPGWLLRPLWRNRTVFLIARVFTFPALAFFLYNADFWLWHAPPLYNATLENQGIHILEHVTFIVFGVLYWWPILSPSEELPRLSLGGQVLYIFLAGMPTVALGAGLTFLPPLYAPYLAAPRIWGLSAAVDQQLGGLIMWIPGNIFYIVIISILFIRWMQKQDAKQQASEANLDDAEDKVVAG